MYYHHQVEIAKHIDEVFNRTLEIGQGPCEKIVKVQKHQRTSSR